MCAVAGRAEGGHGDCAELQSGQVGGAGRGSAPLHPGLGRPRAAAVYKPLPRVDQQHRGGQDKQRGSKHLSCRVAITYE